MTLRLLGAQDARDMAAIHAQSFAPPHGSGGWDALEMATHCQKDLCFGLDSEDDLAAFIILSAVADQAEILTIATAPSARRTGLGRALLDLAISELEARGVTDLFLEVAEDNAPAIALYRSTRFIPMGRRPGYYRRAGGRVAALTLSRKLKGAG
jgi:ribosomal-protein-alanine N-acetyltransferase